MRSLSEFKARLKDEFPILAKTVLQYADDLENSAYANDYGRESEQIFRLAVGLVEKLGQGNDALFEHYAEFCLAYLREQEHFLATQQYAATAKGFAQVKAEVYDNDEYMRQYMIGHLLSCALFPHHYAQYDFFRNRFVTYWQKPERTESNGLVCEFGCGHGLWLTFFLSRLPSWRGLAFDISPACLELSGLMLDVQGIKAERVDISLVDVMAEGAPRPSCEAIIANGLLEHLERPDLFLKSLAPCLQPEEGRMFIMTPTNVSHPDHLVLFKTVDDIKALFTPAGLRIVEDLTIDVPRTADEKVYLSILARDA